MEEEAEPMAPVATTYVETTLILTQSQIDLAPSKRPRLEELPPSGLILSKPNPIKLNSLTKKSVQYRDILFRVWEKLRL